MRAKKVSCPREQVQAGDARRKAAAHRPRPRAARAHGGREHGPVVVSLPAPNGAFQRFELQRSELMAPGLAQEHPEIATFSGGGLDDPTRRSTPT